MKLTPAQSSVLGYIRGGWELGSTHAFSSRKWIQKGGIGRGGESINVHPKTFVKLLNLKLVVFKEKKHSCSVYQLTELGKTVKL
jgi:hypothetical protein